MSVEEITAVAQDYLKVIWSAVEWGEPAITTKDLAVRFGTSPANVSETVRRLANQNLVAYEPYKPVTLTPRGTELALAMVRRHRLIETFLVTGLGYDWAEVHDEAERLEHAVSDTLINRIDQRLGHPPADPHGDPIPAADGTVRRPENTLLLSQAPPGRYQVVRISDTDPEVLARLQHRGIRPGSAVRVEADPDRPNARLVIGPDHDRLTGGDLPAIRAQLGGQPV